MRLIKKDESTAARRTIPFVLVDTTGALLGNAANLALTIMKGGTSAFAAAAGSITENAAHDGSYIATLDATDVDTLGCGMAKVTADGAQPQFLPIQVVAFDPYDANALGLSRIDAAVTTRAAIADYSAVRAAKLDNLDAAISTRAATVNFDKTGYALSASGLDSILIEGITLTKILAAFAAVLLGEVSGANGTTVSFMKVVDDAGVVISDADERVRATVDQYGNRTAVGLNLP
jgi:hypothetical protein